MDTPDNLNTSLDEGLRKLDLCQNPTANGISEDSAFWTMTDLLKDEDKLRELYLSENINRIRQYVLLRLMGAGVIYIKAGKQIPPEHTSHVLGITKHHPAQAASFQRDFSRVLEGEKTHTGETPVKIDNPDFEDPFSVGIHNLEKLRSDTFTGEMSEKVKSFYLADKKKRLINFMGKLPQNLPVSIQTALMGEVIKDLSDTETNLFGQAQKIWFSYNQTCKDVSVDARFLFFHALESKLNPEEAKKIFGKLIKEFFSAPDGCKNSIHTLVGAKLSHVGPLFAELVAEDPKLRSIFIDRLTSGNPMESAFAAKILGEYCNAGNAPDRIKMIIKNVIRTETDCKDPSRITRLGAIFPAITDSDENSKAILPTMMDTLLDVPGFSEEMPVELYREHDTAGIIAYLKSEFEIFGTLKPQVLPVLEKSVEQWLEQKPASEKLFSELQKITIGDDIDKDALIEDIILKTSLPLIETRRMEMDHIFGKDFKIYIKPNTKARASLGSWTVRIEFMGKINNQLTHEFIELDFDECILTNAPPPGLHDFAEKIGLLIGHKYFVKQKDNSEEESTIIEVADQLDMDIPGSEMPALTDEELIALLDAENPNVPESGPETDAGNADVPPSSPPPSDPAPDSNPPDSGSEPPDSTPRPYGERTEEKITIDIRDHDKKAIEEKQTCVKKTLSENKDAVESLMKGQTEGVDLTKILLHRKTQGEGNGKTIFERVTTEELKSAVEHGTLGEKDWFILNTLPHMKVLPYRFTREHSGKVEYAPEIWLVKKQNRSRNALLAYTSYLEAGFPELSPFAEIRASFGILADAIYNPDEYVEIRTEEGKNLHMGKTVNKDLNARLAEKMKDPKWMKQWEESQRKVLNQESENTYNENISDDEKLAKDYLLDKEVKDLPDLTEQVSKQTSLKVRKTPDEIIASVRLAFGWVPTQTSFNQGHFISLQGLKAAMEK